MPDKAVNWSCRSRWIEMVSPSRQFRLPRSFDCDVVEFQTAGRNMRNLFDIHKWKYIDYPLEQNPLLSLRNCQQIHFSGVAGAATEPDSRVAGKQSTWTFVNILPIWKVFGTIVHSEPLEVFADLKSKQRLRHVNESFQNGLCVDFCGNVTGKVRFGRQRVELLAFRISGDSDIVTASRSTRFHPVLFRDPAFGDIKSQHDVFEAAKFWCGQQVVVTFCCEEESRHSLMRTAECVWNDSIGWASRLSTFLHSQLRKGAFRAYVDERPETRTDLLLNLTVNGISFSPRADDGFVEFSLFSKHPDISGCVIEVSANARGKMCGINVESL